MAGIIAAGIGAGVSLLGGIFGAKKAKKQAKNAEKQRKIAEAKIEHLENTRVPVVNPYESVTNVSGLAADLSGQLSNPFQSLGVATQAAEMQIEEADIALANTLDTIRATGSGAGGATALAQAALQSKKGVAASIEQQEANNEQLRAQGESNLQNIKMSEAQRVQGALMGEQGRLQQAGVSGSEFMYRERENREMQRLNRKQAQITGQQQQQVAAQQAQAGYIGAGISAVGNIGASAVQAKAALMGA